MTKGEKKSLRVALIILTTLFLYGSPLAAQDSEDLIWGVQPELWSTSTSTTSTAALAGGAVLTFQLARSSMAEVETYLEHNAVALQHDFYLGGGESARDLATLFQVQEPHLFAFTSLLFEHRDELSEILSTTGADSLRAHLFTELVIAKMLRDPLLAPGARELLG